jgi:acetyltransferase-like isoleucine patch superfamily enzyme
MGCTATKPSNLYRCKIGNNCKIGPFVEIQSECTVGDSTVISSHCFIAAGTRIGSNVFLGHGVITCNDKRPSPHNADFTCEPPTIEDGASIGSGAIILPGVRIGAGSRVGAGAIIVRDVPSGATVVGLWKSLEYGKLDGMA